MARHPFGHESSAISIRPVLVAMGILAIFVLSGIGILHLVLHHELMPDHVQVVATPGTIPPAPRLQANPSMDLTAERAQKHQLLSDYAWLDSSRLYARIPIQRAMYLYTREQSKNDGPPVTTTADASTEAK